jgi:hypothetical protein
MSFGLSDRGEELQYTSGFVGQDADVTVYLDNTDTDNDGTAEGDDLSDTDGTGAVTTEPSGITRPTITIQSSDVGKFNGDFGIEQSLTLNIGGVSGDVDGVLLIESGTTNILARAEIQSPEPGPYQSLDGLKTIELIPRITTD